MPSAPVLSFQPPRSARTLLADWRAFKRRASQAKIDDAIALIERNGRSPQCLAIARAHREKKARVIGLPLDKRQAYMTTLTRRLDQCPGSP